MVDLFLDIVSNLLSFFKQILQNELSAGIFEDGVGDFSDGQIEILDSVVGVARVDDFIVDCGIDVDGYVIFGYDVLGLV